jgi:hypothetical protein
MSVRWRADLLLQEREQLSAVADKGAKLRLRRQDVIAKQEQLTVLTQTSGKLEAFLGCTGRGMRRLQALTAVQCCLFSAQGNPNAEGSCWIATPKSPTIRG